MHIIRHINK